MTGLTSPITYAKITLTDTEDATEEWDATDYDECSPMDGGYSECEQIVSWTVSTNSPVFNATEAFTDDNNNPVDTYEHTYTFTIEHEDGSSYSLDR